MRGPLPENLRQAYSVSSFKAQRLKLIFLQKLSYSSVIILTNCSLPFALFYGVSAGTYCTSRTLLQCFLCFILFGEALFNSVFEKCNTNKGYYYYVTFPSTDLIQYNQLLQIIHKDHGLSCSPLQKRYKYAFSMYVFFPSVHASMWIYLMIAV